MVNIDVNKLTFAKDFAIKKETAVVLEDKGREIIMAFDGSMNGRQLYNIRGVYEQYGEWRPGKGISVPAERKHDFLKALKQYVDAELAKMEKQAAA